MKAGDIVCITVGAAAGYRSRFEEQIGLVVRMGTLYHEVLTAAYDDTVRKFLFASEECEVIGEL